MSVSNFFTRWFYISVILILIGIILSSVQVNHISHVYILSLISKLFESIGIAIFVANIFTFTIGTDEFLKYIRDKLMRIVISKEFVAKLDPKEQKNLLHMVLKPTQELSNIYSGINDYFNQYVEDSMSLFDTNYRGHMVLDATASIDKEKNILKIEFDLDYMVYKVGEKFDSLKLGLEEESSEHVKTIVRAQGNIEQIIPEELITESDEIEDPTIKKLYDMTVPEEFNKFDQINVSRTVIEYGNDHWQVFSYKTIKTCDRLTVVLRCKDGLVIRNCNTYGVQDKFIIERDKEKIKVVFNDWLSPGFGVNILIAREGHHEK
jgi:hypothetical protein